MWSSMWWLSPSFPHTRNDRQVVCLEGAGNQRFGVAGGSRQKTCLVQRTPVGARASNSNHLHRNRQKSGFLFAHSENKSAQQYRITNLQILDWKSCVWVTPARVLRDFGLIELGICESWYPLERYLKEAPMGSTCLALPLRDDWSSDELSLLADSGYTERIR